MGTITHTKFTDWLHRKEPVVKWFHEFKREKLREGRRESKGRYGRRRRRRSSGRGFNFKLQMLTVTPLGWAVRSVSLSGKKKKEKKKRKEKTCWTDEVTSSQNNCVSGTSLSGFSSRCRDTSLIPRMSWPPRPLYSPADVPYMHTHPQAAVLKQTLFVRHMVNLCPLAALQFSQSLTWSPSHIPVSAPAGANSKLMNEEWFLVFQ